MFGILVVLGLCIPCWSAEPAACNEDAHCMEEYFCDMESYSCRQCLRCEDHKRAPPGGAACAQSVADCGGCLEQKGENYGCGPSFGNADSGSEGKLPVYAWVLLALMLVVIAGGAVLIPVVSRLAYAPVSISEGRFSSATNGQLESTWVPPPAYTSVFNPSHFVEDEPGPYVKPSAPSSGVRESADRQETVPFDPPNYVRGPRLSAVATPETQSINNDSGIDNSDAGVISLRNLTRDVDLIDAAPADAGSNMAVAEFPTAVSPAAAAEGSAAPLVVVNNNLHVQSVALAGATIILPQSRSKRIKRRVALVSGPTSP